MNTARKIAMSVALVGSIGSIGCSTKQVAELKHLEVVVVADADTLSNDVIGLATSYQTFATSNPALAAKIQGQLADATAKLATKAGVSAADVAALKSDITSPGAPAAVIQAATNVKVALASATK